MDELMDEPAAPVTRSRKKLMRVSFPDGTVFCYKNVTLTYIETLRKIGMTQLRKIDLEIGHLPIFSRAIYPKYKSYMKPVDEGWYVNVQSDSSQKYLQLLSIKNSLGLDYVVELGEEFDTAKVKEFIKSRQPYDNLLVKFPDGTFVGGPSPKDSYIETIMKIGPELLCMKEFQACGREIVTRFQKYPNQNKLDGGLWLTIPGSTKDKIKVLNSIRTKFKIEMEFQFI